MIPARGGTNPAKDILCQVETVPARVNMGAGLKKSLGESLGNLDRLFQQVKGQALGCSGPDARKFFQFMQ